MKKCVQRVCAVLTLVMISSSSLASDPLVGVNVGAPIWNGNILFTNALAADIASSGCRQIRVNFRIDGNQTWTPGHLAKYDQIIDTAVAHNLEVTGIIAYESIAGTQAEWNANYNTTGTNPYINELADIAWLLIDRYKDDVKLFEIWNEPSCWSTPPGNTLTPGCFYIYPNIYANLLAEIYYEVTAQGGANYFTNNGISLISGGLFAHDIAPLTTAMDYMNQVYGQTGIWSAFQANTGRQYPWDYFGYHFYLNQGSAVSISELNQYFNIVRFNKSQAGDNTDFMVTEFGWNTSAVSTQIQADNLTATYNWMRTQPDIRTAHWYQWNNGDGGWGLTFSIGDHKPSYFAFAAQCGVVNAPTASFDATPITGLAPLGVQFDDISIGVVDTYLWNFGDGATSTQEDPQHTYTDPGSYDVTLTVTGPGGQDSITKNALITVESIGDYNADLDTDMHDVAKFQQCFDAGGTVPVSCETTSGVLPNAISTHQLAITSGGLSQSISNNDLIQSLIGTVEGGGFHEATPGGSAGGLTDLTDGVLGINVEAVLADFARPSLVVRYNLSSPVDIERINVFAQNNDGRIFQNYNVEYSTTGSSNFSTLLNEVRTGAFGQVNNGTWNHSLTSVIGDASGPIATEVDALRFTFYSVSTVDPVGVFWDPWDVGEPGNVDGVQRAYVSSIIKEIDVIEYNGLPLVTNEVDLDGDGDADTSDLDLLLDHLIGPAN